MSYSNQIICYTSPHLSLHVPFFFLLIILTHCYVIVYSFYYPPLQAYLQYKKSLSNIIHLSHRQILVYLIISVSTYKHKYPNSFIQKRTPCINIKYKGFVFIYNLSSNLHLQCLFCIDSSLCC